MTIPSSTQLHIVNSTNLMHGGHGTTSLVNDFVNSRLGNYGAAVEKVILTLSYPPKAAAQTLLRADFQRSLERSPRVKFFRVRQRVEVFQICRGVSPAKILADGHLTFRQTECVVRTAADALELIRPRFRPTDAFDCEAFITDAQDLLLQCPQAIRKWLS